MHSWTQTYKILGKDKSPNVHGRHKTGSQKWNRIGNSNTHNQNIQSGHRMELCIEKCATLVMKSGKRLLMDRIETDGIETKFEHSEKKKRTNIWGYWKLIPPNKWSWKKKFRKNISGEPESYSRQLYSRNLIKRIYIWAVLLVTYLRPFLKWTREELKQMDQRTRKLMTMHTALHPRDDVDILYVSRKDVERGIANTEDSIDASIQRLEDSIRKRGERLITAPETYWLTERQ